MLFQKLTNGYTVHGQYRYIVTVYSNEGYLMGIGNYKTIRPDWRNTLLREGHKELLDLAITPKQFKALLAQQKGLKDLEL